MLEFEDEVSDDPGVLGVDCLDEEGLRVMAEGCITCIFRPGNLMSLEPGRLKGMVEDVIANDGFTPCHEVMDERPATMCHGMTERHPGWLARHFPIHRIDPPKESPFR